MLEREEIYQRVWGYAMARGDRSVDVFVRKLRQKLISTLFDSFMPDLVLLDMVGEEAELEARLLLERARAFGSATLLGVSHERPGEACFEGAEMEACERCRSRTCVSAREALELRDRARRSLS